jgi:hypothetical protein
LKAISIVLALSAAVWAPAAGAQAGKQTLREGLFANRPVDGRRFAAPPVARYVSEDGESFVFDRSGTRALLKFDASPEIWVLQSQPAPRGDIIYKNDLGGPMLRATRLGGVTVFTDQRPQGTAAALSGPGQALKLATVGPVALAERVYQASARASRAARRTIPFIADNATPASAALISDAATVAAEGIIRLSRRKDGARLIAKIARVVFVEGRKAEAVLEGGSLRIGLVAAAGRAGRPSSEKIAAAVAAGN